MKTRGLVSGMDKQLVPVGYKQTELGIIPEDWEVCNLIEAVDFLDGLRRPVKSTDRAKVQGIYPYYGASGIVDYVNDYIFDDELILLGEDGENILSRNLPLAFRVSGKIWVNNHAHVLKPKGDFSIGFLTDFLEHLDYSLLNSGTAQPKLNKQACSTIKIAKPSKKEQTAIANALSDVDALIAALEKLINKKSAIKTAAMQQLLTGKKRLPPFDQLNTGYKQTELGEIPGDWKIIDFGDLFQPSITRKSINQATLVSFVGMQDVSESAHLINTNIIPYIEVRAGFTYFEKNDVLVAKITPCFENGKGCITEKLETTIGFGSTEFHVLRANDRTVEKYLYFITTTGRFRKQLESEMVGSAGHRRVPMTAIEKYRIPCSNHVEEQTAIANALSDMDKEIEALQQRLHKTQQIKQGMMQELLTGKTRLVPSTVQEAYT